MNQSGSRSAGESSGFDDSWRKRLIAELRDWNCTSTNKGLHNNIVCVQHTNALSWLERDDAWCERSISRSEREGRYASTESSETEVAVPVGAEAGISFGESGRGEQQTGEDEHNVG